MFIVMLLANFEEINTNRTPIDFRQKRLQICWIDHIASFFCEIFFTKQKYKQFKFKFMFSMENTHKTVIFSKQKYQIFKGTFFFLRNGKNPLRLTVNYTRQGFLPVLSFSLFLSCSSSFNLIGKRNPLKNKKKNKQHSPVCLF